MTLPYFARLICLSLACFFVLHLLFGLSVRAAEPYWRRITKRSQPDAAAQLLLGVRFFPPLAALLLVLSLCVPSYLWLEVPGSAEEAGLACLFAALLAVLSIGFGAFRAALAVARSRRYVLENASRSLMLSGIRSPRLHVPHALAESLPAETLAVALRHEEAHRESRDNLKRLLLLLTPDALPGLASFRKLDRDWAKFAEWAADDRAVAGDRHRAVQLAEALLQAAKLGTVAAPLAPISLLLTADEDLAARVDRLLAPQPANGNPAGNTARWPMKSLALGAAALAVGIGVNPGTLYRVHELLEFLMH
jgi:hypothetical protein